MGNKNVGFVIDEEAPDSQTSLNEFEDKIENRKSVNFELKKKQIRVRLSEE